MADQRYFLDSLDGENYNVLEGDQSVILTLRRTSHAQADQIRKALEYAYTAGTSNAGSFQEGYDHGYATGYRQGSEDTGAEAYALGRNDYHEELWNRSDSWPNEIS